MSWYSITLIALLVYIKFGMCNSQLSPKFYATSCPKMSKIVRGVIETARRDDARIGAKLIRLQFHDCFVSGCDASLLLDDANGKDSEKNARPNSSVEGYAVIDEIKTKIEKVCPGVVSCADIISLASQISVSLDGGPAWQVQLGRKDSRKAFLNRTSVIPGPRETLSEILQKFRDQGLDSTDLVALSGAQTFGSARCPVFSHRLYNFNGTGRPDPSLDAKYLQTLRGQCPNIEKQSPPSLIGLDRTTPNYFDNNYFKNLKKKSGLLQTDQELFSTPGAKTVAIVERFAESQTGFFENFSKAMMKMGNIMTLTGNIGEIRMNCRKVN